MLNTNVNRQTDRFKPGAIRQSRSSQIGVSLLIDIPFHAGQAEIVNVYMTDNMGSGDAAWIETALL
jgi:hypothetical protein